MKTPKFNTGYSILIIFSCFILVNIAGAKTFEVTTSEVSFSTNPDYYELQTEKQKEQLYFPVKRLTRKKFSFSAVTPRLIRKSITVDSVTYKQYEPPGGKLIGQVGKPGLPGFTRLILVPEKAQVEVNIKKGMAQTFHDVLIFPMQPSPPETPKLFPAATLQEIFQGEDFVIDHDFYQKDFTYPERLYEIRYDWIRGCRVAIINIHTAKYNPYQQKMTYYPNLQVDIKFKGGKSTYIPMIKRSIFFEDMYSEVFSNYEVVAKDKSELISRIPLSQRCDLLIITPAVFEAQANQLAEWKTEKGFITKVTTLEDVNNAQGGTSSEDIREYIRDIYSRQNLSYVILLGDAELIPPHYVTPLSGIYYTGTLIGTDLYYAEMDGEGYFPDLGIGRISVDTTVENPETDDLLAMAQKVINKIIAYEQSPPNDRDFYGRILHTAIFEDKYEGHDIYTWRSDGKADKSYVKTMEEIRDYFFYEGYPHLPRQYFTDQAYWPEGHLGPQFYSDGTPIPAELFWPEFAWDGGADGIIEELNTGSFLALYRGHGNAEGWTGPSFISTDLDELHNGSLTPVTLSFTCETGWFDTETDDEALNTDTDRESFAEKFFRMEGGTVAIVAAARPSNPDNNNKMIQAFIDCIWNDMLRDFPTGEDGDGLLLEGSNRLGDALNYAKFYVASQVVSEYNEIDCLETFEMYHLFGDPTMEIWTAFPYVEHPPLVDPDLFRPIVPLMRAYRIPIIIDDVTVSLIQNGKIISQGISENGWVQLKLKKPLSTRSEVSISFNKKNYLTQTYPLVFGTYKD